MVGKVLGQIGLVGESRGAKLIYLILTSRLLDQPLCAAVKGPSSAGKSNLIRTVLSLFPASATVRLSSMSEKALVYLPEDLRHKTLVVAEASGLSQGVGAYLLRSLVSEGRLSHATADMDDGVRGKITEREGPTGLLVTTTKGRLDEELETRVFSVPIDDSPEQTTRILGTIAEEASGSVSAEPVDLSGWLALQEWLELSAHRVVVPFAKEIADRIPPVAVRLRRDFSAILGLVKAHTVLHRVNRQIDDHGRLGVQSHGVVKRI
jgi:hypothetical protein